MTLADKIGYWPSVVIMVLVIALVVGTAWYYKVGPFKVKVKTVTGVSKKKAVKE